MMATLFGIIFLTSPIWYGVFFRKKKLLSIIVCLILAAVIAVSSSVTNTVNNLNTGTLHIFKTEVIDGNNGNISKTGIDYKSFITESSKSLKNILILASDMRPNAQSDFFRSDTIILISIDLKSRNIYVFTLPRDTLVRFTVDRSGENTVCKLGEVTAKTGTQGLINTIRLNFGIDIDEYIIITWQTLINFFDSFFSKGITIDLTEIELLGINQTLPAQNKSFGLAERDNLITEYDSDVVFGEKELAYLHEIDRDQELYRINELLRKNKKSERQFDTHEKIPQTLNSHQLLAYLRNRHPYRTQDVQRQRNTLSLIQAIIPELLNKINDTESIERFDSLCSEKGRIPSTYSDIKTFITDIIVPIKSIHMGKTINGDLVTSLPYLTYNYAEKLDYTYKDLRYQTNRLIYEMED